METLERWEGPEDTSDQEAIPGVAGGSKEAGELFWGGRSEQGSKGGVSTAFHVAETVLRSVHWVQRAGIVRPCWDSFHRARGGEGRELRT